MLSPLAPEYVQKQIPILAFHTIWNWSHRIGGIILVLLGLKQLRGFAKYHRILGYIYVILVGLMSIGGVWMVFTSPFSPNESLPTIVFAFLLLSFTFLGVINAKNFNKHTKWMQRSFAIAIGPLFVRLIYMILEMFMPEVEAMTPSFWIGWGIPLLILETGRKK